MRDCSEVVPTSGSIFADDLKLYCSYDSVHNNPSLVNTIKNIEMWSCHWQLKINPDKSILLQVGNTLQDRCKYSMYLRQGHFTFWLCPRFRNSVR